MTKEERRLLLVDLCSRLPYGVMVRRPDDGTPDYVSAIDMETGELMVMYNGYTTDIEKFLPYLRPISDMTDEEKNELSERLPEYWSIDIDKLGDLYFDIRDSSYPDIDLFSDIIDWLNAHHFNYRLPKHLFIEVTKKHNPYEPFYKKP